METTSLHQLLSGIVFDDGTRAAYRDDPDGFLRDRGYDHLDAEDVDEAILLFADELPPTQAEVLVGVGGETLAGSDGAARELGRLVEALDDQGPEWFSASEVDPIVSGADLAAFGAGVGLVESVPDGPDDGPFDEGVEALDDLIDLDAALLADAAPEIGSAADEGSLFDGEHLYGSDDLDFPEPPDEPEDLDPDPS